MPSLAWTPSAKFLAQMDHLLAGALILVLAGQKGYTPWHYFLGLAFFAGLKEFWADLTWLEQDSLAGSLLDFTFYVLGGVAGWLALCSLSAGLLVAIPAMLALMTWDILSAGLPR